MQKVTRYFEQSWAELSKVVWPNRQTAIRLTIAVIIFSLVLSVIIGALDYVYTTILQKLILKG